MVTFNFMGYYDFFLFVKRENSAQNINLKFDAERCSTEFARTPECLGMKKPTPLKVWVFRFVARRGFEPLLPG